MEDSYGHLKKLPFRSITALREKEKCSHMPNMRSLYPVFGVLFIFPVPCPQTKLLFFQDTLMSSGFSNFNPSAKVFSLQQGNKKGEKPCLIVGKDTLLWKGNPVEFLFSLYRIMLWVTGLEID